MKKFLTGLLLASVTLPATASDKSMQPIAGDPVQTTSGRIAGTELDSGVKAYLGIPFAEPPVGDPRWPRFTSPPTARSPQRPTPATWFAPSTAAPRRT